MTVHDCALNIMLIYSNTTNIFFKNCVAELWKTQMVNLKSTWLNLKRHMPQFEGAWCFLPLQQIPLINWKIMRLRVHASYWLHCRQMKSDIEFVLNHGELLTALFLGSGTFIINHIMTAHVWWTGLWCNFWRSDFRGSELRENGALSLLH